MKFSKLTPTIDGKVLQARLIAEGLPITITDVVVGKGELDDETDVRQLTSLIDLVEDANVLISDKRYDNTGNLIIEVTIGCGDTEYPLREFGIMVANPFGTDDVLMQYTHSLDDGDVIPAKAESPDITTRVRFVIPQDGTEINVSVDLTTGVSRQVFEDHLAVHETMFTDTELSGVPTAPTADEGTRTGQIATTEFVMEQIDKVYKEMPEDTSASAHTHPNKTIIDAISSTNVTDWNAASGAKHSHTNKSELDNISDDDISRLHHGIDFIDISAVVTTEIVASIGDLKQKRWTISSVTGSWEIGGAAEITISSNNVVDEFDSRMELYGYVVNGKVYVGLSMLSTYSETVVMNEAGTYSLRLYKLRDGENLTKEHLGLGDVTNESKATMFTNSVLTGAPTAPTPAVNSNNSRIATTEFVTSKLSSSFGQLGVMKAVPPAYIGNMPTKYCVFVILWDEYDYDGGTSNVYAYTMDLQTGTRYRAVQDSGFDFSETHTWTTL